MKMMSTLLIGVLASGMGAGATVAAPAKHTVSLVGPPLVMRLNTDEFRIAVKKFTSKGK